MPLVTERPITLTADDSADVVALSAAVTQHDSVAALSERSILGLTRREHHHVLARGDDGELQGYAQVWPEGTAELMTSPEHRRTGVGSQLWKLAQEAAATSVWAHGNLPAAQGFAEHLKLAATRRLQRMQRPLTRLDQRDPDLPEWVRVSSFAEDPRVDAVLTLNSRAFADHPEQGRMTLDDFTARTAADWFDPAGLLLLFDAHTGPSAGPIAFHWTKRTRSEPEFGEVYVVGVDPAYQGRGLASPLTDLGLAHLARQGSQIAELYVDADNVAAVRTYESAGFDVVSTDVMYALSSGT